MGCNGMAQQQMGQMPWARGGMAWGPTRYISIIKGRQHNNTHITKQAAGL